MQFDPPRDSPSRDGGARQGQRALERLQPRSRSQGCGNRGDPFLPRPESPHALDHPPVRDHRRPQVALLEGGLAEEGLVEGDVRLHPAHLVVCEGACHPLDDLAARIDAPDLEVSADDFLVLQNAGPKSGYAMPEAGYLPIPAKLARAGVKDMVRISDARMSGTAYGTIVLHVSPEAAIGGPLALVENGDPIELDIERRALELKISEAELQRRRATWRQPPPRYERGYGAVFSRHIGQADRGCDFDFLEGTAPTPEPEIH